MLNTKITDYIKENYNNISHMGFKPVCRAVELLMNNDDLTMMDIYKLIALEEKKGLTAIVSIIRSYKNKTNYKHKPSKEFIYMLQYDIMKHLEKEGK